ncbi:MAG: autotransporter outer membrane beta-barrel domain-containing protein, partial [Gammaproteobacteria bacterium]
EAGFEADDFGVTAGIDYTFNDRVVLGLAGGYNNSDADIDNNGGKLETDSYSVFGYWSLYPGSQWFVDAMVGYTDNNHDQTRNIIYNIAAVGGGTTAVNNAAISDTDSEEWSASITAGRDFVVGRWILTPLARFDYADVEIDAFTETMAQQAAGAGLALAIDGQDFESMMLTAGTRLATQFESSLGTMFPELSFEYVHEFKNDNAPITGRFVNDSSNTTIVLLTDGPDRNFFNVGAGVTAVISDNASGYVRYQGLFGYADLDVHAVEIGVRATF